jgi:hypothetical protein
MEYQWGIWFADQQLSGFEDTFSPNGPAFLFNISVMSLCVLWSSSQESSSFDLVVFSFYILLVLSGLCLSPMPYIHFLDYHI